MNNDVSDDAATDDLANQRPTTWSANGWTARIIKNEDDDGWAVEMTAEGASEPSLVGPWTMGRDKKNPKPIDASSFAVLVRGANEVGARAEAQRRATLHRSVTVDRSNGRRRIDVDIVPDEDDPHAILTVHDSSGAVLTRSRVAASFKLNGQSARAWLDEQGDDA